jgi:hypothetical protein
MHHRLGLTIFLLAAGLSLPALAASVDSIQGQVSVNRGNGYQRVAASTEAKAGDQVMASPAGSANIVYADGCVVSVKPGAVVSVGAQSPCTARFLVDEVPGQNPHPARPYIIGAAVVAGVVAIAVIVSQSNNGNNNNNKPASP